MWSARQALAQARLGGRGHEISGPNYPGWKLDQSIPPIQVGAGRPSHSFVVQFQPLGGGTNIAETFGRRKDRDLRPIRL